MGLEQRLRLAATHPASILLGSPLLAPAGPGEAQRLRPDCLCPTDLFFPGATKQSFMHLQPSVSHPSIYIDTNGQPSSLPDVEGSAVPRLAVQSPDPAIICEYSRGEGQSSSGTAAPPRGGSWMRGLDGSRYTVVCTESPALERRCGP